MGEEVAGQRDGRVRVMNGRRL